MATLKPPVNSRDHLRGDPSAPIQLVEFGDYECPFCGDAHGVIEDIEETLRDQLLFVFRNFPIEGAHPHALVAAEAAEAAGAQGKLWEMHDLLFEHQDALEEPDLLEYAGLLGMDLRRFSRDLATHRFLEKIRADLHSGAVSGVNGTPTFFINGTRHDGSYEFASLMAAISGASGGAWVG
jgi:protein-disulfide isomerase